MAAARRQVEKREKSMFRIERRAQGPASAARRISSEIKTSMITREKKAWLWSRVGACARWPVPCDSLRPAHRPTSGGPCTWPRRGMHLVSRGVARGVESGPVPKKRKRGTPAKSELPKASLQYAAPLDARHRPGFGYCICAAWNVHRRLASTFLKSEHATLSALYSDWYALNGSRLGAQIPSPALQAEIPVQCTARTHVDTSTCSHTPTHVHAHAPSPH